MRRAVSALMWCAWCALRLPWALAWPFTWLAEELWWQRKLWDAETGARRYEEANHD